MVHSVFVQPQFNSQERLHQFAPQPSAEELLQLQQRFGSSASITPADSTFQLPQQAGLASCDVTVQQHDDVRLASCEDDDVTDDVRETCRRESVASCSSNRSMSFLRLRSHSLR